MATAKNTSVRNGAAPSMDVTTLTLGEEITLQNRTRIARIAMSHPRWSLFGKPRPRVEALPLTPVVLMNDPLASSPPGRDTSSVNLSLKLPSPKSTFFPNPWKKKKKPENQRAVQPVFEVYTLAGLFEQRDEIREMGRTWTNPELVRCILAKELPRLPALHPVKESEEHLKGVKEVLGSFYGLKEAVGDLLALLMLRVLKVEGEGKLMERDEVRVVLCDAVGTIKYFEEALMGLSRRGEGEGEDWRNLVAFMMVELVRELEKCRFRVVEIGEEVEGLRERLSEERDRREEQARESQDKSEDQDREGLRYKQQVQEAKEDNDRKDSGRINGLRAPRKLL